MTQPPTNSVGHDLSKAADRGTPALPAAEAELWKWRATGGHPAGSTDWLCHPGQLLGLSYQDAYNYKRELVRPILLEFLEPGMRISL